MPTQEAAPIVGLDIGTAMVRVVIADAPDGELEIIGVGEAESKGLRKGVISKPDLAVEAIKRAIEAAERMAGLDVQDVYVGLSGAHIKGENSQGMIAIPGRNREITDDDIARVQETACAISITSGREMADVLPQEYTVDDQDGIDDPRGMLGARLSVSVHIVTSPVATKQNIINCVERAGFGVADIYLTQLAAAEAVLSDDDKEYGTALINIGGETASLAVYQRGAVWHTAVLPVGGSHFTNDIAFGLRTPVPEAERIKRESGCASRALLDQLNNGFGPEMIEVPSVGDRASRTVSRGMLCEILEPRAEEMFVHLHDELRRAGYDRQLSSGIVLTGGGAMLPGLVEVAESVFDAPVRIGLPHESEEVAQAGFATAVGLVLYGLRCEQGQIIKRQTSRKPQPERAMATRLKEWFGLRRETA
jgi:cell division protein FtsA